MSTGEFTITIRANEGKTLKEIEAAVFEALNRFEKEGITEKDIERVKASSEKKFYDGISSVFNKSIQLAYYNTFLNDPGYIEKDIENIKAVTLSDVKMVYDKYIKGKPHIVASFVPKGKVEMIAENSVPAGVKEENIKEASKVDIAQTSGTFTSILNQILREEKGFTYGATSYFQEMKAIAPFVASTSVRSDATMESV